MPTETGLRELISKETKRQKLSYRRATIMIALVALGGLAWIAFSAFNVVRLQRMAKGLNVESVTLQQQIKNETQKLEEINANLAKVSEDLAEKNRALNTARTKLNEGDSQGARKVLNAVPVRNPTPTPTPSVDPGTKMDTLSIQIDGNLSLQELEKQLEFAVRIQHAVLVSLSAASTTHGPVNVATFKRLEWNYTVPRITLTALEGPGSSSAQAQKDKILIERVAIYVNEHLTRIAVFKERLGYN